jgi:hypothetical protein
MKIIDNFLNEEEFATFKNLILDKELPWFFAPTVADSNDFSDSYFIHTLYNNFTVNSSFFSLLQPILKKLEAKALIRCRILRYVGREKLIEHNKHTDFDFPHNTCILYLNTNDGFTRLHDNSCVQSVENRALISDGSLEHNSTNCTNANFRLVLTINYF